MTSRDQGCRGMVDTADVTLARLRSPLIRGVENLGAGRIEHSGLQAELPPLYETRRGSKIWYKRARARYHATHARTHARTHATAVHTHQGIPRKDRNQKKTRIEQEYETRGNEINQKSGKLYRNEDKLRGALKPNLSLNRKNSNCK